MFVENNFSLPNPGLALNDENKTGTVISRLLDGLGFRYYWATEWLRPVDLTFKPSPEARTSQETQEHIYSLSDMIITAVGGNSVPPGQNKTFEELRRATLENFKKASTIIAGYSDADMENLKVAFHGKKLPFWNMINGPDVGVEIYLYKKRFVHAKTIVADGQLAIVGSANMDHRSFELNFEVNSVIYDHEIAQQLRIAFFEHLKEADKIDPGIWAKRSRFSQLPEKLARLLSPLL